MLTWIADLITLPAMARFVVAYAAVWPVAETFHFLGMALLFGTIALLDLRMLGFAKAIPMEAAHSLVPWGIAGFLTCLITGLIFVTGHPYGANAYFVNHAFLAKMVTLALAGLNVAAFYLTGTSKAVLETAPGADVPRGAKIIAGTSLVLWLLVIYFGRMIMYRAVWQDLLHL
jgi:hypothetical protein